MTHGLDHTDSTAAASSSDRSVFGQQRAAEWNFFYSFWLSNPLQLPIEVVQYSLGLPKFYVILGQFSMISSIDVVFFYANFYRGDL